MQWMLCYSERLWALCQADGQLSPHLCVRSFAHFNLFCLQSRGLGDTFTLGSSGRVPAQNRVTIFPLFLVPHQTSLCTLVFDAIIAVVVSAASQNLFYTPFFANNVLVARCPKSFLDVSFIGNTFTLSSPKQVFPKNHIAIFPVSTPFVPRSFTLALDAVVPLIFKVVVVIVVELDHRIAPEV